VRTMVKNRIHVLVDRQAEVRDTTRQFSYLFGIRYERSGATPSPSSPRAMRYGATIRDWGTWEHAGWAGRSRTMSRELALVFGRPCDLPECAVSANP